MPNKKNNLSLWEKSNFEILSETETETELISVLRNRYNGARVICKIPKHTQGEEEKLSADLTFALMQIAYTGQDLSYMKNMEILK